MLHNPCSKVAEDWLLPGAASHSGWDYSTVVQIPSLEGELDLTTRF